MLNLEVNTAIKSIGLFQNSVLRNHLKSIDVTKSSQAYAVYKKDFLPKIENIKTSKEEQYQYGFLDDLFVKVLGYTLNPTPEYNLIAEQKNLSDSKKADGAILKDDNVIAVIELKSTKTKSMDKIVNQAFNYKHNHPTCKYVITSNFEKLRLYVEHSDRYEEFDLFTLDEEGFTLLYTLLSKESLFADIPLTLKSKSKLQEENISNELYKKYATLRTNLFENIIQNNPNIDKYILLEKTQTILDRMVFIFFGEDRGILPTNTIRAIIEHYEGDIEDRDLWHFYKIYFKAINQGNSKLKIPEYNGGLFATDDLLDSLVIDKHVLDSSPLSLSAYDFNSDIDVNILGHIFENSLNDIEELKARIEDANFDAKQSKRKKDGVFYTPEYITKYIVENTLGTLCQAKREELGLDDVDIQVPKSRQSATSKSKKGLNKSETKLLDALEAYRAYLLELKILDPACGSGAFLNQALNFLLEEHRFIDEGIQTLMGGVVLGLFDVKKGILENNLYGVDINAEAVEIAKLSLWLRTVESGRKLNKLADKIKVGNSLIDDKSVADDAFVWEEEFPEVFAQGGFDVVIGNPPYIRVQGLKSNYSLEAKYYEKRYQSAVGKYDVYVLFMEKSFELLNKTGKLSFILPHKFLVADFGYGMREYLAQRKAVEQLIHFGSDMVFADASTYTCIILLSHNNEKLYFTNIAPSKLAENSDFGIIENSTLGKEKWNLIGVESSNIIERLKQQPLTIKEVFSGISQGIVTTGDDVFVLNGYFENDKFIGYSKELESYVTLEKELMKPFLKGDAVKKYAPVQTDIYVIYPHYLDDNKKTKPYEEEYFKDNFPLTYTYLEQFKTLLTERKIKYKTNPKYWYALHRSREIDIFENEKIITPEISLGTNMTFDSNHFYHGTTLYSLIKNKKYKESYQFYLSILNSKLMWFFLKNTGTELRGGYFRFKTKYLEPFPLPKLSSLDEEKPFVDKVDILLELSKIFQSKKTKFLKRVKDNLSLDKLSKKLEAFYEYEFKIFLAELKKKKVTLTLKEQDEWEEYFEAYQKELLEIQAKIDAMDKLIDEMVYALYGFSEDEIAVVEGRA